MSKKIVVLNGSPRANGNTSSLIASFTKGAEEAGNTVATFHLQGMRIGACLGCYGGGNDPEHPCVQKDDMDKIYPVYREANVVVLGSPLYFWTVSGQLKCAFDRLFAMMEGNPGYRRAKECALIMAADGNEYEETLFWYERLVGHLGWKDIGRVLACHVPKPGDVDGTPYMDKARKLGAAIRAV